MQSVLAVGFMCVVLAACHRPSELERKLIGTWEAPGWQTVYSADGDYRPADWVMRITFTPDYKETWHVPGTDEHAVARWHLEGDELVFTTETESFYGPPGTTRRERIARITPDEVVFTDGTAEGRWRRVR